MKESVKQHLKNFGLHIKKLREEKRITILELSKKTGIRKEYLQKIEKGTAYGVLLNRHIFKIAKALEVTIFEIFEY